MNQDKLDKIFAYQTKRRMVDLSEEESDEYNTLLREYVMEKNMTGLKYLSRKSDEDKRTDFTSEDWT